ncbi:MAG: hypothetical protein P9L98_06175 [Candidatus Kaelpia imicola]|nr:hypothetical protein [Candidatus Kaelpia imicola]
MYRFILSLTSIVITASFFLPWVNVEQTHAGAVKKVFTGEGAAIIKLSGFNIPLEANGSNSSLVLNIAKFFNFGLREFAHKSWFLWLVPVFAISIVRFSKRYKRSRSFNLFISLVGFGISLTVMHGIVGLDLDKFIYEIKLKEGFWVTLVSFFVIGLLGLMQLKLLTVKKPKH